MFKYTLGGDPPQSRSEQILMGQDSGPAQSRLEELLKNGAGGGVTPEQIAAAVEAYLEEHPVQVELFEIPITESGGTYSTTATAEEILAHADNCVVNVNGILIANEMSTVQGTTAILTFSANDSVNGYLQNSMFMVTVTNGSVYAGMYNARADSLPTVTTADNGKSLVVENGAWGKGYQAARTPRVAMTASDTTPTLDPNKLYVFPEMATLTPTLATPTDSTIVNEYHFIFASGMTPTTLTIPASIRQPDGFTVEANMIYEVSILENCMTAMSWEVTA